MCIQAGKSIWEGDSMWELQGVIESYMLESVKTVGIHSLGCPF